MTERQHSSLLHITPWHRLPDLMKSIISQTYVKCFFGVFAVDLPLSLGDFIWLLRQRGGGRQRQTGEKRERDTLNCSKCGLFTVRGVRDAEKKHLIVSQEVSLAAVKSKPTAKQRRIPQDAELFVSERGERSNAFHQRWRSLCDSIHSRAMLFMKPVCSELFGPGFVFILSLAWSEKY